MSINAPCIDPSPFKLVNIQFACYFIINGNAPAVAISSLSGIACWVFVLVRSVRDLLHHLCVILPGLNFVTARKSSDRPPNDPMNATASEGRLNHSMAHNTAVVNGSYELDDSPMKTAQPMKAQSYMLKNDDGLSNSTSDLRESQSDFRNTHCRSPLASRCIGPLADAYPSSRLRAHYKHHVLQ